MSTNTRCKIMTAVAIAFFAYAILWALAPFPSINLPARIILDISDWPLDSLDQPLDRNTQWLSSISAGLLAAIAILLAGIVIPAIKSGNTATTNTTIAAFVVWYLIDSVGSYSAGVASNVAFNTVYLVLAVLPLLGLKERSVTEDQE